MEIFGNTSSASLFQDRRLEGYSGRGGFCGEERKRQEGIEGRQSGCWARGPRNLLRAILPTTCRASGMRKARVSLVLEMYFIATEDGVSLRRGSAYYSFESTLDLNKSMQTSWPLFTAFCLSVALLGLCETFLHKDSFNNRMFDFFIR